MHDTAQSDHDRYCRTIHVFKLCTLAAQQCACMMVSVHLPAPLAIWHRTDTVWLRCGHFDASFCLTSTGQKENVIISMLGRRPRPKRGT